MELAAAKVAVSTGCAEIVLGKSSMLRNRLLLWWLVRLQLQAESCTTS